MSVGMFILNAYVYVMRVGILNKTKVGNKTKISSLQQFINLTQPNRTLFALTCPNVHRKLHNKLQKICINV